MVSFLAVLLLAAGVLVNRWSLEQMFAPDRLIESALSRTAILGAQAVLLLAGAWLLWRRPPLSKWARGIGVLAAGVLILIGAWGLARLIRPSPEMQAMARIDRVEARIAAIDAGPLRVLSEAAMNLALTAGTAPGVFADRVTVLDLAADAPKTPSSTFESLGVTVSSWPPAHRSEELSAEQLRLWAPFLERVLFFEHARFYVIAGDFEDEAESRFKATLGFEALARMQDGSPAHVMARGESLFAGTRRAGLRLRELHTTAFEIQHGERLLFTDVLGPAISNQEDRLRLRTSEHQRLVLRSMLEPDFPAPHEFFDKPAFDRHPGVSIVDIDGDGFDDIYVMARWGRNMLLRNRGDGSFEDVAPELGLDLTDHSSSAIFADFDNDGDPDVVIGRTLERSRYMRNDNGRFVDRSSSHVDAPLPYLVSSVSAVDYNLDGLLDVYLTTYAASMLTRLLGGAVSHPDGMLLQDMLDEGEASHLYELHREPGAHPSLSFPGPPNVLLRNVGDGRFERVEDVGALAGWRNTYQTTWSDFDGDGDPDAYLANDFSPNTMVRNDGDGRFVDITAETGTADIGFGMGVSWGDYDNDGAQDLYVTNMFSKAGRRIIALAGGLAREFAPMAEGNSLYRSSAGRFDKIAPSGVNEAGWSWGGQFVDVDLDGQLDIFALSGYYTAPLEVAVAEDT